MQQFERNKVDFIINNQGNIINLDSNALQEDKVLHIVATKIDENVIKSIKNLLKTIKFKQIVVNRTKFVYSNKEIDNLNNLNDFINNQDYLQEKNVHLEFAQEDMSFTLEEVKQANKILMDEAEIINNAYVTLSNGERRPFSPVEKLYLIHCIVANNEYIQNDDVLYGETRNLYAVLQKNRKGMVCVGYANWFKALADTIDPNGEDFKVAVVSSFTPKMRKENLEYEKISNPVVYNSYYNDEEKKFHATNIILLNDDIYNMKGVYHNDSTFDRVKNGRISFLHFLWPFGGFMKQNKSIVPLYLFSPDIDQAENLSNLIFVDPSQLKISKAYIEYLKHPAKVMLKGQQDRVLKLLNKQIENAKIEHFLGGKEYSLKQDKNIFKKHDYIDWESALTSYIEKNRKKLVNKLITNGLVDHQQAALQVIKLQSQKAISGKNEKGKDFIRDLTDQAVILCKDNALNLINALQKENKLPDIKTLYKADVDLILEKLVSTQTNNTNVLNELNEYFESGDYEGYVKNIEQTISDSELTISDIRGAQRNEGRNYFKNLIENDKSDELQYYNLNRIRDNVFQYLSTISGEKLKDANIDLSLI